MPPLRSEVATARKITEQQAGEGQPEQTTSEQKSESSSTDEPKNN